MPDDVLVGVDVGGTHTDLCLSSAGVLSRAKALTDHADYSGGILAALATAADQAGTDVADLLGRTSALVIGTTIVTNSITELRGARVGVVTTRGFRDTFRLLGGARQNVYDDHLQVNPPPILQRSDIAEVDERISRDGAVVVPLDEAQVREAVQSLRASGVDTVAVCYLWSFANSAHEQRTEEIIREEWPEVFVTTSSAVHPVVREYERFMTAVLNSFCHPAAKVLLEHVHARLRAHGFAGHISFVSGAGGAIGVELAARFPILMLGSGPAAGVTASIRLGAAMGVGDILVGDMGGTSFDTSVITAGSPSVASKMTIAGVETGVRLLEVISIGTGGGSIASLDARGVPQVGPRSAGSLPGPACYGRGGSEATVTDAAVVLGVIDPARYLGGRLTLDAAPARTALEAAFRESAAGAWTAEDAARGILELTATNMAHALRTVTVERGHDPRDFLMVAYGGMLPVFVTHICEKLGVDRAVVPRHSSVFSALGTILSDYVRRYSRTVDWDTSDADGAAAVNLARKEMREAAIDDARRDSVTGVLGLQWGAECRFRGQVYELEVPLEDADLGLGDPDRLGREFRAMYEAAYGAGTAWRDVPVSVVNLTLTATGERRKPTLSATPAPPAKARVVRVRKSRMLVVDPSAPAVETAVHLEDDLAPGDLVEGPCIVDQTDSTLVIRAGWVAALDGGGNFLLTRRVKGAGA